MSIFRRRTRDDVTTDDLRPDEIPVPAGDQRDDDPPAGVDSANDGPGPLDEDDVDGPGDRLDLGGLWIPVVEGMQVRAEVDQSSGDVSSVHLVLRESALQLQAFAAPRSSGIWDEIRREIGESIRARGGSTELVEGEFGTELRAQMPQADPQGRTMLAPVRFVGVDGPRWFLRGVISGRAAVDESAAGELVRVIRETVVCRGVDPMAPRELLPMRLPNQPGSPASDPGATAEDDGFNPLERGPEITEVR